MTKWNYLIESPQLEQALRNLRANTADIHAWERAHNTASHYDKAILVQWRRSPNSRVHIVTDVWSDISRIGFVSTDGWHMGEDLGSVVSRGIWKIDITDKPPPPPRPYTGESLVEAEDSFREEVRRAVNDSNPQALQQAYARHRRTPSAMADNWDELKALNTRAERGFHTANDLMTFVEDALNRNYAVAAYAWGRMGLLYNNMSEWELQLFRSNTRLAYEEGEPIRIFILPRSAWPRNYNSLSISPWRNVFFRPSSGYSG